MALGDDSVRVRPDFFTFNTPCIYGKPYYFFPFLCNYYCIWKFVFSSLSFGEFQEGQLHLQYRITWPRKQLDIFRSNQKPNIPLSVFNYLFYNFYSLWLMTCYTSWVHEFVLGQFSNPPLPKKWSVCFARRTCSYLQKLAYTVPIMVLFHGLLCYASWCYSMVLCHGLLFHGLLATTAGHDGGEQTGWKHFASIGTNHWTVSFYIWKCTDRHGS